MARRRAITEEQNHDEDFSQLSIEAEHLWYRMLSVADDYGIVPASAYWLKTKLNLKEPVLSSPLKFLEEIVGHELGFHFEYDGKNFFAFKPGTFLRIQSQFVRKRTNSECLRLGKEDMEDIMSGNFREFPGISGRVSLLKSKESRVKSEVLSEKKGTFPEIPGNSRRFQKPELAHVAGYFVELGSIHAAPDAERFQDYYEANGWRVGRNPMKDWKAAARNWHKNNFQSNNGNHNAKQTAAPKFGGHDEESIARIIATNSTPAPGEFTGNGH